MSQDIENFNKLKAHLRRVAAKNKDRFETCVTWTPKGYNLEVKETADGHTFLAVDGPTIFVIIDRAEAALPEACESWGYEYVQ